MKTLVLIMTVLSSALLAGRVSAEDFEGEAIELADSVMKACGSQNWGRVKSIDFTFNVEQEGKLLMSARHHWNVRQGTDAVTWNGKTVTVNVTRGDHTGEQLDAYKRWVNDAYWLLMPLKLKDPGVNLTYKGPEEIDGNSYWVLHLSFGAVGITTNDQYNLYIDRQSHLVRFWDYMPTPDRKVHGTWDEYREFGGLLLSLEHKFGDKRIWFSNIEVETD